MNLLKVIAEGKTFSMLKYDVIETCCNLHIWDIVSKHGK